MIPFQTILVATDFSEASNYAFEAAVDLAGHYHARLIVMHVAQTSATIEGEAETKPYSEEYRCEHRRRLDEYACPEGVELHHHLMQGEPAERILHAADSFHADLIVMGTHGKSGLERLLLGSVAETVIRAASSPVMVVRRPLRTVAETGGVRTAAQAGSIHDAIEEASEESFPASDAPAWNSLHIGSPVAK
jgi:nucleotide-binding universal stress UspA family protein